MFILSVHREDHASPGDGELVLTLLLQRHRVIVGKVLQRRQRLALKVGLAACQVGPEKYKWCGQHAPLHV